MTRSILIVEDDPSLVLGLQMNLSREGYEVRIAMNGPAALQSLDERLPDLVLLDLMLPGINGLEILRQLRERGSSVPVVVLTAMGTERDKIQGLDLGANDYVTKPFSIGELLARIRAALRTHGEAKSQVLRAGAIELDPQAREVSVDNQGIELSRKEFDLLRFLMERPERVLSRDQILTGVWGFDYSGTTRTVDNVVCSLRQKIGSSERHLRTVRGIGYRFVP